MERQRNTTEMKAQTRNTDVQTNEEEIGKPPEKELRIMITKMIKSLENKIEKMQTVATERKRPIATVSHR